MGDRRRSVWTAYPMLTAMAGCGSLGQVKTVSRAQTLELPRGKNSRMTLLTWLLRGEKGQEGEIGKLPSSRYGRNLCRGIALKS